MRVASIFFLALVSGCTIPSMPEMREYGPERSFQTLKNSETVANCILFSWQESNLGDGGMPMALQPRRGGGSTVYAGRREYFVDVMSDTIGTRVEYYSLANNWVSRDLIKALKLCL